MAEGTPCSPPSSYPCAVNDRYVFFKAAYALKQHGGSDIYRVI